MEALLTKAVLALSIGLQLAILIILMKRRLHGRFFWFLIYIAYVLVEAIMRLSVAGNPTLYFYVYWLTTIGSVILSLLAVRESFLNVFRMYMRFVWFTRIVWGFIALALLYPVMRAWLWPPVHATRLVTVIIALELILDYSLAAIGFIYFILVRFEKIKQHQWESAVISGFMTLGTFSALGTMSRSVFGTQAFSTWAAAIAYLVAEIEWIIVLSRPEAEPPDWVKSRKLAIDDLTRLDEYIDVLKRLRGKQ